MLATRTHPSAPEPAPHRLTRIGATPLCASSPRGIVAVRNRRATHRRMIETASHLVDHVLSQVPIRQWVLSFPWPLRLLFTARPEVLTQVVNVVARALTRAITRQLTHLTPDIDSMITLHAPTAAVGRLRPIAAHNKCAAFQTIQFFSN